MGKVSRTILPFFHTYYFSYKKNILLLLFFLGQIVCAQTLSGIIYNKQKQPVKQAIINLYSEKTEEELIGYTFSDAYGKFSMNLANGQYTIVIQALGYHKLTKVISLKSNLNEEIVLEDDVQEIKEVIVTKTNPIKIKKDTVEYNAKSFRTGTERSVEDLLKNLPGVVVEEDGKIKINNKEIEKVTVDNDDFFERGYTLLTKNMSQKPIDKIQVIENYSNNKLLKGVEKSEKVIINLTLDNHAKTEWFGEMTLANSAFPNDYYDNKLSLGRFAKNYKYFFLAAANSIGKDNTGNIQHLIEPSHQNEAGMISISENPFAYDSKLTSTIALDDKRFKMNQDKMISNNAIFRLGKNRKLKLINLFNFERVNNSRLTTTQYNLGDIQFETLEQEQKRFKKNLYFNKLEYDYEISKNQHLKYLMSYTLWDASPSENSSINETPYLYRSDTKNNLLDAQLLHTYRFKNTSAFLTGVRYFHQAISNNYSSNQFFFEDLFHWAQNPNHLHQFSNNKIGYFGIINQFIHRNKKDGIWDISLLYTTNQQQFNNQLKSDINGAEIPFPNEFSNAFRNDNNELVFKTKYQFKYARINFNTEINLNYWNTKSSNLEANLWYINPNFDLRFSPHDKANFNVSVFANSRKNELYDRLPNYLSDSPRSFRKGLENEFLTKNYGVSFNYTYGHFTDKFNANIYGSWMNHEKYQSNHYTFTPLYTISELLYLKNRNEWFLSTELSYFLRFIKSNFKFRYLNSTNKYQETLEPLGLVDIRTVSHSFGLELQSGWKKKINYSLASTVRYNEIHTKSQSNLLNHKAYLRLQYAISKTYYLELYNYYYSFGGMFKKGNSYNFMDIRLSYNASDKVQLALSGNNLTNTKVYAEKFLSSYSNYLSETKLFPRNIMVEFNYNFGN